MKNNEQSFTFKISLSQFEVFSQCYGEKGGKITGSQPEVLKDKMSHSLGKQIRNLPVAARSPNIFLNSILEK